MAEAQRQLVGGWQLRASNLLTPAWLQPTGKRIISSNRKSHPNIVPQKCARNLRWNNHFVEVAAEEKEVFVY